MATECLENTLCAGDGDYSVWVRPKADLLPKRSRYIERQGESFPQDDERVHCPSDVASFIGEPNPSVVVEEHGEHLGAMGMPNRDQYPN